MIGTIFSITNCTDNCTAVLTDAQINQTYRCSALLHANGHPYHVYYQIGCIVNMDLLIPQHTTQAIVHVFIVSHCVMLIILEWTVQVNVFLIKNSTMK